MIKAFSISLPVLALLITGCSASNLNPSQVDTPTQNKPVTTIVLPYTAKFAIYTNNTFRVFTNKKYHNQSREVYIEAKSPNTVQIAKTGITWNTFFNSIHLQLDYNCLTTGLGERFCTPGDKTLKFYLNGSFEEKLLEKEINPDDRVLITYGSETPTQIQSQLETLNSL